MGFSHGGWASLYSSLRRFARMHGPADGRQFAAHIAFYTGCLQTFREGDDVSDKPIRLFHGGADDWLPIEPCRDYADKLRKAGKDVSLTGYPGAHHAFDRTVLKEPVKLPVSNLGRCQFEEGADGVMLNASTRQPFTTSDPCVQRGATIAYDAKAHAESVKAVTEFLKATFGTK
jgi:dienelactone hydrolase